MTERPPWISAIGCAALVSLACSALFTGAGFSARGPVSVGPVRSLNGLTLWTTVPAAHYGPGRPVSLILTLRNRSLRAVQVPNSLRFDAVILVDGKEISFPQDLPELLAGPAPGAGGTVALGPRGARVWRLTVRPPRSGLTQGIYTCRVLCTFPAPHAERLASNEAQVTIKYDVMLVY